MIKFLIKGLRRDKSRSRIAIIVVTTGVLLTVFVHSYIVGFMGDSIELNAIFSHGHLSVTTRAYAKNISQIPNDLAITGAESMLEKLRKEIPEADWAPRIQFGGLIDVPDSAGETRVQGPAAGMGIDLLSGKSREADRLNLGKSVIRGRLISSPGEIMISEELSRKLEVSPGNKITLISSTMNGSMSMTNFTIAGTISFGTDLLDKGFIITDINDARNALDMADAAGEIVGFSRSGYYDDNWAGKIAGKFNSEYTKENDEFSPVMSTLSEQGSMGMMVNLTSVYGIYITSVFVIAMALVLWNAGLLGSLRRYGEFGVRLAMGESKGHLYRTIIYEAVFTGITGTIAGTAIGLLLAWFLQVYGIDISGMMKGASMMVPSVIRARITPIDFYIGLIPGLLSTVAGAMLAGAGIYKRKTSQLFKELEA
jgi:putative ABC transport system permease protein